jgi:hypothetical protein
LTIFMERLHVINIPDRWAYIVCNIEKNRQEVTDTLPRESRTHVGPDAAVFLP